MKQLRNPAMLVACLALFVALGGTAVATGLVTGAQIKDHTITSRDIRSSGISRRNIAAGAISATEIATHAITSEEIAPDTIPAAVAVAKLTPIEVTQAVPAGAVTHVTASCPPGMNAISGDWQIIGGYSYPFYEDTGATGYSVGVDNFESSLTATATARVFCAPAGAAVIASKDSESKLDARDAQQRRAH